MLSICIGIYNWDVTALVAELQQQATQLNIDFEIILIDDASTVFQETNSSLSALSNVFYFQNETNIGRSAIRNLLVAKAKYANLLFMDCDTAVYDSNYIKNYIEVLSKASVISGGYLYSTQPPSRKYRLRWTYGKKVEEKSANERNKNPNFSFSTFNFLIKKSVFSTLQFDESITGYGHEDTLFGWELAKKEIVVLHIDNPLLHKVQVASDIFLQQTEQSIRNLLAIYLKMEEKELWISSITLLRFIQKIEKLHLRPLFCLIYKIKRPFLKKMLITFTTSMLLFNFYKAGYLALLLQKQKVFIY